VAEYSTHNNKIKGLNPPFAPAFMQVQSTRESSLKGWISTVDLLMPIGSDELLFIFKTIYLNEEFNCTKPSPAVDQPMDHVKLPATVRAGNPY
jgi:hypothetical protein